MGSSNSKSDENPNLSDVFVDLDRMSEKYFKDKLPDLRNNEYGQMALKYLPVVINIGKRLVPLVLESVGSKLNFVVNCLGYIGVGLACFAVLAMVEKFIGSDYFNESVKDVFKSTIEYVKIRYSSIEKHLHEIEYMILKYKMAKSMDNSEFVKLVKIALEEKIRVCRIDISECIEKMTELLPKIETNIEEFHKKMIITACSAAGVGVLSIAGIIAATVLTGGLAIVAGVAAGGTSVATSGLSFWAKWSDDTKKDFIVLREKFLGLHNDIKRQLKRLEDDVKELEKHGYSDLTKPNPTEPNVRAILPAN